MDDYVAQIMARVYAINAEIEGMKALNTYREARGETIAYDEDAFQRLADKLSVCSENILNHRRTTALIRR